MFRESVDPQVDARIFHNSAKATKAINLAPRIMRGGIRL